MAPQTLKAPQLRGLGMLGEVAGGMRGSSWVFERGHRASSVPPSGEVEAGGPAWDTMNPPGPGGRLPESSFMCQ